MPNDPTPRIAFEVDIIDHASRRLEQIQHRMRGMGDSERLGDDPRYGRGMGGSAATIDTENARYGDRSYQATTEQRRREEAARQPSGPAQHSQTQFGGSRDRAWDDRYRQAWDPDTSRRQPLYGPSGQQVSSQTGGFGQDEQAYLTSRRINRDEESNWRAAERREDVAAAENQGRAYARGRREGGGDGGDGPPRRTAGGGGMDDEYSRRYRDNQRDSEARRLKGQIDAERVRGRDYFDPDNRRSRLGRAGRWAGGWNPLSGRGLGGNIAANFFGEFFGELMAMATVEFMAQMEEQVMVMLEQGGQSRQRATEYGRLRDRLSGIFDAAAREAIGLAASVERGVSGWFDSSDVQSRNRFTDDLMRRREAAATEAGVDPESIDTRFQTLLQSLDGVAAEFETLKVVLKEANALSEDGITPYRQRQLSRELSETGLRGGLKMLEGVSDMDYMRLRRDVDTGQDPRRERLVRTVDGKQFMDFHDIIGDPNTPFSESTLGNFRSHMSDIIGEMVKAGTLTEDWRGDLHELRDAMIAMNFTTDESEQLTRAWALAIDLLNRTGRETSEWLSAAEKDQLATYREFGALFGPGKDHENPWLYKRPQGPTAHSDLLGMGTPQSRAELEALAQSATAYGESMYSLTTNINQLTTAAAREAMAKRIAMDDLRKAIELFPEQRDLLINIHISRTESQVQRIAESRDQQTAQQLFPFEFETFGPAAAAEMMRNMPQQTVTETTSPRTFGGGSWSPSSRDQERLALQRQLPGQPDLVRQIMSMWDLHMAGLSGQELLDARLATGRAETPYETARDALITSHGAERPGDEVEPDPNYRRQALNTIGGRLSNLRSWEYGNRGRSDNIDFINQGAIALIEQIQQELEDTDYRFVSEDRADALIERVDDLYEGAVGNTESIIDTMNEKAAEAHADAVELRSLLAEALWGDKRRSRQDQREPTIDEQITSYEAQLYEEYNPATKEDRAQIKRMVAARRAKLEWDAENRLHREVNMWRTLSGLEEVDPELGPRPEDVDTLEGETWYWSPQHNQIMSRRTGWSGRVVGGSGGGVSEYRLQQAGWLPEPGGGQGGSSLTMVLNIDGEDITEFVADIILDQLG